MILFPQKKPLKISGCGRDNFGLGFKLGRANAQNIQKTVNGIFGSVKGSGLFKSSVSVDFFKLLRRANLMKYSEEMAGLASGADVSYEHLIFLNCFEDWIGDQHSEHCSLVFRNDFQNGTIIGWNEDGDGRNAGRMALAEAQIKDLRFLTLQYPGLLCGDTLSITSRGLVVALQSLDSDQKYPQVLSGLPKGIVGRRLLEEQNVEGVLGVINKLSVFGFLQGFHVFVYDLKNDQALSLEVEIRNGENFIWKKLFNCPERFIHTNHCLLDSDRPESQRQKVSSPSSRSRLGLLEFVSRLDLEPKRLAKIMSGQELPPNVHSSVEAGLCRQGETTTLHSQIFQRLKGEKRITIWTSPGRPDLDAFKKWRKDSFKFDF